jgi:hypothetical protein
MNILLNREAVEAKGLIDSVPYSVASDVFKALHRNQLDSLHIPHSDVYYVRAALEKRTGYYFPLDVVEKAMRDEGWRDRRSRNRYEGAKYD